jgi:SAM-dependent methyltransferase
MDKTQFGSEYFDRLYGAEAKQTWADKLRDGQIERIVDKYAAPGGVDRCLLDIGCGYGYLLERFRDRFRLFGMDISEHGALQAQNRLPGSQVKAGDVQQGIPFPEKFQVILMINVVEHLTDPRSGLSRVRDALQPGGICVVHLPTINNSFNAWVYSFTYSQDPTHVYKPSGRELSGLFRELGFERLAESYSPHYPKLLCNLIKLYPPYLAAFRRP